MDSAPSGKRVRTMSWHTCPSRRGPTTIAPTYRVEVWTQNGWSTSSRVRRKSEVRRFDPSECVHVTAPAHRGNGCLRLEPVRVVLDERRPPAVVAVLTAVLETLPEDGPRRPSSAAEATQGRMDTVVSRPRPTSPLAIPVGVPRWVSPTDRGTSRCNRRNSNGGR